MAVLANFNRGQGLPSQVYLPSQTPVNGPGPSLFWNGAFYVQYGASAALANSTTETSLLNNTASTTVGFYTQGSAAAYPASTLALQKGMLNTGTCFRILATGIISNTGTPTLRVRVVLKNSAGSIAYTLSDTGAVATTSGLASALFQFSGEWCVTSIGTSGTVLCWGTERQGAAFNNTDAPSSVTVDTTQPYTLDLLGTWGTASAANTLTVQNVMIGVLA